jgi:hypothetical protein
LGSYCQPSPAGIFSAERASIGGNGGFNAVFARIFTEKVLPTRPSDYGLLLRERLHRFLFSFCVLRSTISEDERVSAFRNFLISPSAESFSFFVFDTVQSEGTNKSKSRI